MISDFKKKGHCDGRREWTKEFSVGMSELTLSSNKPSALICV